MENKNYLYDAVALLKELIAIPSISRDETKAYKYTKNRNNIQI
jgi:acetylornithine deacetylase